MSSDFVFSFAMGLPFFSVAETFAGVPGSKINCFGPGPDECGTSIAQRPVDLPPRALCRTLGWVEGVADPLAGIVQASAGTFGRSFLVTCA
jgi:hypothetical protein